MFCPKCSALLREEQLYKTNVKYLEGLAVEYDAECPNCNVMMGHVTWGKLDISPELLAQGYENRSALKGKPPLSDKDKE